MASVHQALVGLAQVRGVFAYPNLIRNDTASITDLR